MSKFIFITLCILSFSTSAENIKKNSSITITEKRFIELKDKTSAGNADIREILEALRYKEDVIELTNFIQLLYPLRSDRNIYSLLYQLWEMDKEALPGLAWEELSNAPVRIAIASNLNRINGELDDNEFTDYIREFKHHEDNFIRSQSIIALGLNRNPEDIPYLVEMAKAEQRILVQASITSLVLLKNIKAREALKSLAKEYYGKPRGDLIVDVLEKGYGVNTSTNSDSIDKQNQIN